VKNSDILMDEYLKHGSDILQYLELETHNEVEGKHRQTTRNRNAYFNKDFDKGEQVIDDLMMELCDKVPHVDRPNFSISNIVNIIPRLLFSKDFYKIESEVTISDKVSYTSTYLNSTGEYAYITGILIYED
jgi:hypothetical protein